MQTASGFLQYLSTLYRIKDLAYSNYGAHQIIVVIFAPDPMWPANKGN